MREPTRTVRPPISEGSTRVSRCHVAPDDGAQRVPHGIQVVGLERHRRRYFRRDLAAMLGELRLKRGDHVIQQEDPPVARQQRHEVPDVLAGFSPFQHRIQRPGLLGAAERQTADDTREVVAAVHQRTNVFEVAFDFLDRATLLRKLEERGRVTIRETGSADGLPSHRHSLGLLRMRRYARVCRGAAAKKASRAPVPDKASDG